MIETLKINTEPLVAGVFCKNCIHSRAKGDKKKGEEFYSLFCTSPDVVVTIRNYAEGEKYTFARRGRVVNNDGQCEFYAES
jgi:hypothetical protein